MYGSAVSYYTLSSCTPINDPTHHAHTHMHKHPAGGVGGPGVGGWGRRASVLTKSLLMCMYESIFGENHQNRHNNNIIHA